MSGVNKWIKAVLTFGGGAALLFVLAFIHINQGNAQIPFGTVLDAILSPEDTLEHHTVRYLRLPRVAMGILAGGALAVSGAVLQTVTKNPLASASTLGIHSGTFFAVVFATVFFPAALGANGLFVAMAGGLLTAFLVYTLSGGGATSTPVKMVLAGMVVSIMFSSFTSVLQIFYEYETSGLFLWGAGSLVQNNWSGVQFALPLVVISTIALFIMSNKLDILRLSEEVSTSLGQNVNRVKLLSLLNAVFLTAVTVSVVGPIGFVGLIAPHLVKLIGYRTHALLIPATFIWGANVLVGADVLARVIDDSFSELPVGAITALIGAPWLILLVIWKHKSNADEKGAISAGRANIPIPMKFLFPSLFLLLGIAIFLGISTGNYGMEIGYTLDTLMGNTNDFMRNLILDLRLPRILVAAVSGAGLAIAGLVLQGILRNPLADPSVIGITSGAGVGALLVLYVLSLPAFFIPVGAFVGAIVAFLLIMLFSFKSNFQPSVVALLGIGISAFGSSIIQILVVEADLGVASALTWLSGSTYARGWPELLQYLLVPIVILVPLLYIQMKKLDVLSLGDDTASGLGLQVKSTRFVMAMLATILAAACVATVGTIGFIGLIAPHLARILIGPNNKQLLPLTAITGAIFLTIADILSRTLLVPKEIPSGVLVALIGAPYFLWLMKRTNTVRR
ncbi:iron ABC transporter permease [Salinibacillus xinjiangensis]|uniref:Iron chelate uptake ABC transporter family permease subunit n=1 Tax=Salinibacillus xinjiangensis TaxID=1229268 RepID=A0A6G1X3W7_9BACI|nr:iron ABC transporter permease [Salinibacillus xinjiangensis]MRG85642.1 iron chelate uptake ABC transporter family permease subunit [Salinibacillus xinjiangensis]